MNPKSIDIPKAFDLVNSQFGKERDPYIPIKGSIIGEAITLKKEEWQNGMNYEHFLKYILKVDLVPKKEDMSYLINLLNNLNNL